MLSPAAPLCCRSGAVLAQAIRTAPATVIALHRLVAPELFPRDLAAALTALPYDVAHMVATPGAARAAGVVRPVEGEVLVFSRTCLLARLPDAPESEATRLMALLRVGLAPLLGRPGAPAWEDEESDAYSILGRRLVGGFAQVDEAWQRRLDAHRADRGKA